MHPILHQFGSYELGTYGVLVAIGVLLGLWSARHLGLRDGLDPKNVNDSGLGTLFAGFLGAAGLGVVVALANGYGVSVADFRNAGAVHGGLLAAMIAAFFLSRVYKLPLRPLLDAYTPSAPLGQAIGRLGCFAAGCCFGSPSDAPWAVTFTAERAHQLGGVPLHVALHPVQLYDAAVHFVLFGVVFALHKQGVFKHRLFGVWCIVEGCIRMTIEFYRGDLGRGVWFDISWLSTGRLTALLMVFLGAIFLSIAPPEEKSPAREL